MIREANIERLQAVAIVLAKSLVLSHYEVRLADVFDRIDPLAEKLVTKGSSGAKGAELMRQIGKVLLIQHKMVGRVEIGEKPELVWDNPELERLYARLAEEYELRDRDRALDRKLDVISQTVETLLGLVQSRSSLRSRMVHTRADCNRGNLVNLSARLLALTVSPLSTARHSQWRGVLRPNWH